LNLGILAHVDAGKTTLTERLLYAAGVIDAVGSVDRGTTQTDTLALERRRGITIRAAVVSFAVGDTTVNLVDTPGHPDFIAEVDRALSVLDGAVLVLSAVEGVQPQTRILMRALQRLRNPTLLFVNKIDRAGADPERVLDAVAERLTPALVALGSVRDAGTREAAFVPFGAGDDELVDRLAELDDALLAGYLDGGIDYARLREALAARSRRALAHPVSCGSAITGAGVEELMAVLPELLPATGGDGHGPARGTVFKVERGPAGEKVAYARLFSGTIHARERLRFRDGEEKVTALAVFENGTAAQRPSVSAGEIAKLWGLASVQVGDRIGGRRDAEEPRFAPPTLEATVVPREPADAHALRVALGRLAEQDPLIDVRQDELGELSVSLYGEVQKEVIEATLAEEYGLEVEFRETTAICVERPLSRGEAIELLHAETNPFNAEIGLRVEPAPDDAGIAFRLDVDPRTAPLYIYKTLDGFAEHMDGYVREALRVGLLGWQVTDCSVTLTACAYSIADGPPSRRGPTSTAADFRKLTPLVLRQALAAAGTAVCEPVARVQVELPASALGAVLPALAKLAVQVGTPAPRGRLSVVDAVVPAERVQALRRLLPGLTGGEGLLEAEFAGYRPVDGPPPRRRVS
jgi:ribosomal protection tetracycline resistance protein